MKNKIVLSTLAKQIGVDVTILKKWERGFELPSDEYIKNLAKILGVSAKNLKKNQAIFLKKVTPGEGYTTVTSTGTIIVERHLPVPENSRGVLDLFCGAGGLSYGFEQSGEFVTTCGIDLLPDRIETFVANHKCAVGISGDIRTLPLEELSRNIANIEVVVGGPPCQGFSSIRPFRTLTEGDPRNSLIEHYVLTIQHLRPKWFVFENVVGLLTHEKGKRLQFLLQSLESFGYSLDWRVINTALFGIPQVRERIVIIGNNLGIDYVWPTPTHCHNYKSMAGTDHHVIRTDPIFSMHLPKAVTVIEAIGDLPELSAGEHITEYVNSYPRTQYQKEMRKGSKALSLHQVTRHSEHMLNIIRHAGFNINDLPKGMVKSGFIVHVIVACMLIAQVRL